MHFFSFSMKYSGYTIQFRWPWFSISVYSHCFPFSLDLSADPLLHKNYLASSLLWSTPTSTGSSQVACVYGTCLLGTSFLKKPMDLLGSVTNLYILADACDPDGCYLLEFTRLTSRYLLLAVFWTTSASHHKLYYGAVTFIIRFRLSYFAVYASSSSLPQITQDSLYSGAGFPFHSRTFTCKISAAFPSALKTQVENWKILNIFENFQAKIVAVFSCIMSI